MQTDNNLSRNRSIRLPVVMWDSIKKLAKAEHRTVNNYIESRLARVVEQEQKAQHQPA